SRSVEYSTESHDGHLIHKPSGTDLALAVPSERFSPGGRILSSQVICLGLFVLGCASGAVAGGGGGFVHRLPKRTHEAAGTRRRLLLGPLLDNFDQPRTDHDRIGETRHPRRRGGILDAEADAD